MTNRTGLSLADSSIAPGTCVSGVYAASSLRTTVRSYDSWLRPKDMYIVSQSELEKNSRQYYDSHSGFHFLVGKLSLV